MEPILEQETPTPVSEEVVPPLRSEEEVAHHLPKQKLQDQA